MIPDSKPAAGADRLPIPTLRAARPRRSGARWWRRHVLQVRGGGGGDVRRVQEEEGRPLQESQGRHLLQCRRRHDGRCGCASIDDCYVFGGNGSEGQVCQGGTCVCADPSTHRCREFDGICGECCDTCSGGRACFRPISDDPFRCYCNGHVAVECEQVCIPKVCASQCNTSCSGPGANCGCEGYLSCQAEAPGVFNCLPTGQFVT